MQEQETTERDKRSRPQFYVRQLRIPIYLLSLFVVRHLQQVLKVVSDHNIKLATLMWEYQVPHSIVEAKSILFLFKYIPKGRNWIRLSGAEYRNRYVLVGIGKLHLVPQINPWCNTSDRF